MPFDLDIAILGSGPVALALSGLLARACLTPDRIAVFGTLPAKSAAGARDPRTLAINYGTRQVLDVLQAWPSHAAPIRDIHVSQRGWLGRTHIRHSDFDVPALGYTVAYPDLIDGLNARAQAIGILRCPPIAPDQVINASDGVTLTIDSGSLRARMAVVADGLPLREIVRGYDQHALLATVQVSQPRAGWAYERFCREGPLALLPHPDGSCQYSLVWCNRPATAARLRDCAEAEFLAALQDAFGERLGRFTQTGARHLFPLSLTARRTVVEGRIVAIGNAAQALHPVAGQGLNLGLRDAVQLAMAVAPALARAPGAPDHDVATALTTYARRRVIDRWITGAVTDLLPRVFATGWAPIEHACGAALLVLDTSRALRAPLARQLLYGTRS
jgi:2-octaprenyl-6-methoxyphenol hydroxylase